MILCFFCSLLIDAVIDLCNWSLERDLTELTELVGLEIIEKSLNAG